MKRFVMKRFRWHTLLGISLIAASICIYWIQILVFHHNQDTFFYLFQDAAFLPVQVLLVTLILNEAISKKAKTEMQKKMNMVVGVFFSEMGTDLLTTLPEFDDRFNQIKPELLIKTDWDSREFERTRKKLQNYESEVNCKPADLIPLQQFLLQKRDFLLVLLENPNLLEHETFTELLWALSHLTEELALRKTMTRLPKNDIHHLAGDLQRVHVLLL
jgi:hypothetical protein